MSERALVTPGEILVNESSFMSGHGTYETCQSVSSSICGNLNRLNMLLLVTPINFKYSPNIGDVVIGRILEVFYI